MWNILRGIPADHPSGANIAELVRASTRAIIYTVCSCALLWHLVVLHLWIDARAVQAWEITLVVVVTSVCALRLLRRRLAGAIACWSAGNAAAITLALILFQQPAIALLYALIPLALAMLLGWPAGLAALALVAALLEWLDRWYGLALEPLRAVVLLGAASAGTLGWLGTRALAGAATWALHSYTQTRQHLDAAQRHRAQLAHMVQHLDHAYYRLERSNTALVAARKAAEEAERFKAEFVLHLSHELRTPLNLIAGFSDVMLTAPESYGNLVLPGPYRSDVLAIKRSARHLLDLADDILNLARIETGRIVLAREELALVTLIAEAADTVRDYIAAKGLELHLHVAPDLPPITVDRLRTRQVLLNLLVNAARFTVRGSIAIEADLCEACVLVRVRDTGCGIRAADLPNVFEVFHTSDATGATWSHGAGLGLPISREFVELHGGQMGVESAVGVGTTFWFTLPRAPTAPTAHAPGLAVRRPYVPLTATEPVVVVPGGAQQLESLLKHALGGYHIVTSPVADDSARLAAELQAVAVITHAPLAMQGDVPVIVCPLSDNAQAAQLLGANDLLLKPVDRAGLLESVDRLQRPIERVLIVDDDADIARLFRRFLATRLPEQHCLYAPTGHEALQILASEPIDLVLLDLMMPDADGREVLAQIRANPTLAALPVIVVSALSPAERVVQLTGPLTIARQGELEVGDVLRIIEALLGALRGARAPDAHMRRADAAAPAVSPALPDTLPLPALAPNPARAAPSR